MTEKKRIRLDVNNMFKERVGEKEGLKKNVVQDYAEQTEEIHAELLRKKEENEMGIGFMELPFQPEEDIEQIIEYAEKKREEINNFVVLGIGGSALGSIALKTALKDTYHNLSKNARQKTPRLFVLDNSDPVRIHSLLSEIELENTLFNVISKSGGTAETMSQFLVAREAVVEELGADKVGEHFVATTSKDSGKLIKIAHRENMESFYIPDNVGGRFSVLTPVGLLFAAMAGIDIKELLAGARFMAEICSTSDIWENPAYLNGLLEYLAYKDGKPLSIMMPYSDKLKDIADWYRQLWAESLGKKENRQGQEVYVGPTPIKALGATDQHSQAQLYMEGPFDKVITFLEVEDLGVEVEIPSAYSDLDSVSYLGDHSLNKLLKTEKKATEMALTKRQRVNKTIKLPEVNEHSLGQLFYLLELQTAYIGELFDINAFNQPGVELGKQYAYGILGREGFENKKEEFESRPSPDEDLII